MEVPIPPSPNRPSIGRNASGPYVPEISPEGIISLVADMHRDDFAVLSGYLEPADLDELQQFVETAVAAAGGEYIVFTRREAVSGTLLDKLPPSPAFVDLLHRVYEQCSRHAFRSRLLKLKHGRPKLKSFNCD